jgi:hypothetical protein
MTQKTRTALNTQANTDLADNVIGAILPQDVRDMSKDIADSCMNYLSDRYTSTAQVITSGGLLTLAHGLASTPTKVWCKLICTTADAGYSVSDEIIMSIGEHPSNNSGIAARVDGTNVYIRFGSAASALDYQNGTTGDDASLTNSSWDLYIYAEV